MTKQDFELIAKTLNGTRPYRNVLVCPACKGDLTEYFEGDHCPHCDTGLGEDGDWFFTESGWDNYTETHLDVWKNVVGEFATVLFMNNGRFDLNTFYTACGWEVAARGV